MLLILISLLALNLAVRVSHRPAMQEREPCRKYSTPVIKKKGRWKPSRDYYYEFHLFCPKCQTAYHVEEAKRFVEQSPLLF
jgi:hypothetical protein